MGAPLITVDAPVLCPHGGKATIVPANTRVKAGGQFVVTQACQVIVSGCSFTVPVAVPMPCLPATWTVVASRVKAMGSPVVTLSSVGMTTGMGPPVPLIITPSQVRVTGE